MNISGYRINLDHRTDRLAECRANEAALGYDGGFIQRHAAHAEQDFGALGCAKSQVAALVAFLTHSTAPYCMILEDDLDFLQPYALFASQMEQVRQSNLQWDVLLLAGTATVPFAEPPGMPFLARIFESQSASGYIVNRHYVPKLLQCFVNSLVQMDRFRAITSRDAIVSRFAIDMNWKQLQREDNWFIFRPAFGHQRPSFSDIERKFVDYKDCSFYG